MVKDQLWKTETKGVLESEAAETVSQSARSRRVKSPTASMKVGHLFKIQVLRVLSDWPVFSLGRDSYS